MSQKDAAEVETFTKFAKFAEIPIEPGSIKHCDPPEPDILCTHISDGFLAFELVELIDEDFAAGINWLKAEEIIRAGYDSLKPVARSKFDELYGNADIHFEFTDNATMQGLARSIPLILSALLELQASFQGECDVKSLKQSNLIRSLKITRGVNGPLFNIQLFMRVGDPTIPALQKKFAKRYQSIAPIELLAYIDRNIMYPANVWRPTVENYFNGLRNFGKFRRVWIVDLDKETVEFKYSVE